MKNLAKFGQKYVSLKNDYSKKQNALQDKKEAIEKQLSDLKYPRFSDYLKRLAKAVLPHVKGATGYTIMGPFGLGSETSLYFITNKKKSFPENSLGGLTFTSIGSGGYGLLDYSQNTNKFAKGTIGEMNRMNHPTIKFSPEMDIAWIIKFMKKQK
jgi:hypothetical protein